MANIKRSAFPNLDDKTETGEEIQLLRVLLESMAGKGDKTAQNAALGALRKYYGKNRPDMGSKGWSVSDMQDTTEIMQRWMRILGADFSRLRRVHVCRVCGKKGLVAGREDDRESVRLTG